MLRRQIVICFFCLMISAAQAERPETRWVLLRGERAFPAELLAWAPEGGRIQAGEDAEPRRMAPEDFLGWMRVRTASPRPHLNARIHFRNGDALEGQLLEMDAETLRLQTAWETEAVLRVDQVEGVDFLASLGLQVLEGTQTLEGWRHPTRVTDDLEVKAVPTAGGLLVNQPVPGIMRLPLPGLPENMLLALTLQLPEPDTPYYLYLFSSERTVYNAGTVHFRHEEGRLLIRQRTYQHTPVEFEVDLPEDLGRLHHLQVYVNHETQRMQVWLNGHLLKDLVLVLRENPPEGGLWFSVSVKAGQSYFLESLRVFQRTVDFPLAPAPAAVEEDHWRITLTNGDQLVATGVSVGEASFTVTLPGDTSMTLPLRVLQRLQTPEAPPRVREAAEDDMPVVVRLRSGLGVLTGTWLGLEDGMVQLRHSAVADALQIPFTEVDGLQVGDADPLVFPFMPGF